MRITREGLARLLLAYGQHYRNCTTRVDTQSLDKIGEIQEYIWQLIQEGNK